MAMDKMKIKTSTLAGACAWVIAAALAVPAEVRADDTEVFFPKQQVVTDQGQINPNILFVIDTSGSMGTDDFGDGDTRLERVQKAFVEIMDGLSPNVNVGLERYSNSQGGPIMFPVAPIDELVEKVDTSGSGGDSVFAYRITDTTSEALEKWNDTVTVAPATLQVQDDAPDPFSGSVSVTLPNSGQSEAEEYGDGTVNAGSSRCGNDLQMISDSLSQSCSALYSGSKTPGNQKIGLRFDTIAIPQGATIVSASITFQRSCSGGSCTQSTNGNTSSDNVVIFGEKSTASAVFSGGTSVAATNKPSGRTKTTASVTWNNIGTGGSVTTTDMTSVVQEIVNQAAWPNTAGVMTFLFQAGTSGFRRNLCGGTYNNTVGGVCGSGTRPVLNVSYTAIGANTHTHPQTMAMRFNTVQIPRGVQVTSAKLLLHADAPLSSTTPFSVNIQAENTDNSAAFTTTANSLDARTWTTQTVTWSPVDNTTVLADDVTSPELKDMVNAVLGRAGWCGGNSMTLRMRFNAGNGARSFIGRTQDANLSPVLVLSYKQTDPALDSGCNRTVLTSQILTPNTDDSFEITNNSANFPACDRIYLGATPSGAPASGCGSSSQTSKKTITALRFTDVNIPKDATVVSAFIDFVDSIPSGTDNSAASISITGEKTSFPVTYTSATGHISARQTTPGQTSASVSWTPAAVAAGATLTTADIKTVLQEIVNRSDWQAKNEMSIFLTGSNGTGTRTVKSVNGSAASSPKLRVVIEGFGGRQTVREKLKEVVNGFTATGLTPTIGAFYEAARYFRGEAAFYGRTRGGGDTLEVGSDNTSGIDKMSINGRAVYNYSAGTPVHNYPAGCSDFNLVSTKCSEETWTGTTVYKSPIATGCQSNNIVILSDGIPNNTTTLSKGASNKSAVDLVQTMIGATCPAKKDSLGNTQAEWKCGDELAKYLHTVDQIAEGTLKGSQVINTYTIAFGPDLASGSSDAVGAEFLENMAKAGGGKFFTASTADEVANAFKQIIAQILDQGTTFVAPSVTVNTFNRLTNRNELYFALFQPTTSARWPGNLKRYEIKQAAGGGTPQVYAQGDKLAVDASTGFFKKDTCSIWTPAADCDDGNKVELGGVASKIALPRKVYTNMTGNSNVDLTVASNAVADSNASITTTVLGVPAATASERTKILNWAVGIDVNDDDGDGSFSDVRRALGDPLHSEPLLVNYGGSDASPDLAIFFGDNQGYLHAVNAADGTELFSFVPRPLLPNLPRYYENDDNYQTRPYGVDGPITPVTTATKKMIFVGLRRGGRSYFALDVTDRTKPKLVFEIEGGVSNANGNFKEMGQSWSAPIPVSIRVNSTDYGGKSAKPPALLISGGYDPAHDAKSDLFSGATRNGDSQGRGIFLIDSETGKLLWSAGFKDTGLGTNPDLKLDDMVYSVPAAPAPVDIDGDGQVDRIYVADSGGQIFRIVLAADGTKRSLTGATGAMIGTISKAGVTDSRHFFNTPDVALIGEGVAKPFLALSIGSGHRERPLDTATQERFYVFKDPDLTNTTLTSLSINEGNMYDATANKAGSSDPVVKAQAKADIAAAQGLFIKMGGSGEKVLTESSTLSNQVIFATFEPPSGVTDLTLCQAKTGTSRFYQINITDATPVNDFNQNGSVIGLEAEDRSKVIPVSGLPPDPVILFPSIRVSTDDNGNQTVCNGATCDATSGQLVSPMVCTGAICFPLGPGRQLRKSYWRTN